MIPWCVLWLVAGREMGCVRRKGPGRHDTWFWVICIWNHRLKMATVIGFSFKERPLRFQLLFPHFYHFHHVIWGMKWAKKLKTKNGQNMSSGPLSHDVAQMWLVVGRVMWLAVRMVSCDWCNLNSSASSNSVKSWKTFCRQQITEQSGTHQSLYYQSLI